MDVRSQGLPPQRPAVPGSPAALEELAGAGLVLATVERVLVAVKLTTVERVLDVVKNIFVIIACAVFITGAFLVVRALADIGRNLQQIDPTGIPTIIPGIGG